MSQEPVELSHEAKQRLEEITLAAFHNLLIEATNVLTSQMKSNTSHLDAIVFSGTLRLVERMANHEPPAVPK